MKRIYAKIRTEDDPEGTSYIDEPQNIDIQALLDNCDAGNSSGYIISAIEMEESEFESLPEFQGF